MIMVIVIFITIIIYIYEYIVTACTQLFAPDLNLDFAPCLVAPKCSLMAPCHHSPPVLGGISNEIFPGEGHIHRFAPHQHTESPWRCRKLAGGWWLVANPKHQLWSLGIIEPFLWLKNLENSKYWKPPPTGPTSSHSSPEKVLSSLGVRRTHFLRSSVHFWTHS